MAMFGFLDSLASNSGLMLLLCSVALALLCAVVCFSVLRGRVPARQVFSYICKSVVVVAVASLAGFGVSFLPIAGVWATVAFYAMLALAAVVPVVLFIAGVRRAQRKAIANSLRASAAGVASAGVAKSWLFGVCVALSLAAAVALALGFKYYMLMFPVALVAVALLLHGVLRWRFWYALLAVSVAFFAVCALSGGVAAAQMSSLAVLSGAAAVVALLLAACVTLTIRND